MLAMLKNSSAADAAALRANLSAHADLLSVLLSFRETTAVELALQDNKIVSLNEMRAVLNSNLRALRRDSDALCATLTNVTSLSGPVESSTRRRWFLEDLKRIRDPECSGAGAQAAAAAVAADGDEGQSLSGVNTA